MTPSGIEPATAQFLIQLRHRDVDTICPEDISP
jgi:hypothetical protein